MTSDAGDPRAARRADYFRERMESLAARLIAADVTASTLRHELEQKRRTFTLLAEMTGELTAESDIRDLFEAVASRINPTLNMQRTAVLLPAGDPSYSAALLYGYPPDAAEIIRERSLRLPASLLEGAMPLLIHSDTEAGEAGSLCTGLDLPYLVAAPVCLDARVQAVLVTGRRREQRPFLSQLDAGDAETVQTIAGVLGAVLGQRQRSELAHMAKHDPLTGLANRRGLDELLERALAAADPPRATVAVLFIDLDGFKPINDVHGHEVGDQLLAALGRRLRALVRECDVIARIGGDEFIVVLCGLAPDYDLEDRVERLLAAIRRPLERGDTRLCVGASIGVARYPEDGRGAQALITCADAAMYAAKQAGGNTCRLAAASS